MNAITVAKGDGSRSGITDTTKNFFMTMNENHFKRSMALTAMVLFLIVSFKTNDVILSKFFACLSFIGGILAYHWLSMGSANRENGNG
jgi:hypothetical protein